MNKQTHRRILLAEIAVVIVSLLFTGGFITKYLIMPQINAESAGTKSTIIYDTVSTYAVEGDILDRNGEVIMGYAEPGDPAVALYPENYSYSYLLGYYSVASGKENKYGLRGNLYDYSLFHLDSSDKGASVTLTTDTGLQDYAYQQILEGVEGSVTVIDNRTGAILCLTSQSTIDYDINDLESFLLSNEPGAQYRRGTFENDPPGSTFKIVTAAAALKKAQEEGLGDDFFEYYDTGTYTPEGAQYTITNYLSSAWGDCDLDYAMANSVNCYFAQLGVKVGAERLKAMAESFMVGRDIEIPFLCTLHSSFAFSDDELITVAQTAFGQGNTQITPVHLCLIAQAFANSGIMMQPYIVKNINDGRFDLYNAKASALSECVSASIAARVRQAMHAAALEYGMDEASYGMVYAKTGTAECADDRIHTYIIGSTKDASFCISLNATPVSSNLYPKAQMLVRYLNNYVYNN